MPTDRKRRIARSASGGLVIALLVLATPPESATLLALGRGVLITLIWALWICSDD